MRVGMNNLSLPILAPPVDVNLAAGTLVTRTWEKAIDAFVKRKGYLEENN